MDLRHFHRQGMETAENGLSEKYFYWFLLCGTNLLLLRVGG
jgi:hypothetical protein